ncbi:MAG: hypothetical protein JW888_06920, partial [Pirellulales bacterium]|nr:hypothetical protein [Pirellulales bacterium]
MGGSGKISGRKSWRLWSASFVAVGLLIAASPGMAAAQTLLSSPFITSYDGWTDVSGGGMIVGGNLDDPQWGVLLANDVLCENSDSAEADGGTYDGGTAGDGLYKPYIMVNSAVTPSQYTLTGKLSSWDDDGLGLVFGYQDDDNYFRVGARQQPTGTYGFAQGLTMQKVVAGVTTQYALPTGTFSYSLDNTPFYIQVDVNGGAYSVNAGTDLAAMDNWYSGSDPDLATLAEGNYGMMSWRSRAVGNTYRPWGAQLHEMTVDNGSNGSIDTTHAFTGASPLSWQEIHMTNAEGGQASIIYDWGNFRLDFRNGSISDDSNPFEYATATAPSVDFIGSAVIVDEPSAATMEDYEMQVRVECFDNEGPGVLVRVRQDGTDPDQLSFYRICFTAEGQGTNAGRPPQGMSIQKCVANGTGVNPTWTELYRETSNPYTYQNDANSNLTDLTRPFDLKVKVVNNASDTSALIYVSLIDDPEGAATEYAWDVVADND